ncbi:head maturation protease, ClpP-related [Schinkia sp. CFF1]
MKIEVKGPIINDADQWIYDWFGIPATSPSKVNGFIDRANRNNDSELLIVINSGGGSVFSASEIYTALKSFSGKVKIQIVGLAASAASVIAMSGYCEMAPTGQLMIHNASTSAWGDYKEMDYTSDFLQKVNQTIVNAYKIKTNKSDDELKAMMNKTTWMTAQEAKEFGFIDAVMFENEYQATASLEHPALINGLLPPEVINKIREQLKEDPSNLVINSTNTNESGKSKMDLQQLKNEHPELVNQIVEAAVNNERARIKEIENVAVPGAEEIIAKAKFETGASAGDVAIEILKNDTLKKSMILQNIQEDAEPINEVDVTSTSQSKSEVEDKFINKILANTGLGGK